MMRSINEPKEDVMRFVKVIAITLILLSASVTVGYAAAPCPGDIMDTLCANKDFSTLVKYIRLAGLEGSLRQPGPLTIFAPSNSAFAKIPNDVLCALERPENKEKLKCILLYHVIKCRLPLCEILQFDCPKMYTTLQGDKICITHRGNKGMVNKATVRKADIQATNGLIHMIDRVLVPPGVTLPGGCPPCPQTGVCPG